MARPRLPHGRSGHRFAFLAGAAALGAVGVGLIVPAGPVQAFTTDASTQPAVTTDSGEIPTAQAAAAIPQAQARAHTIAEVTAQRTAAAEAAQAAQAAAAAAA